MKLIFAWYERCNTPLSFHIHGKIMLYHFRSKNQYDGIEFSYSFWMYINEADYNDDVDYRHVFHKGSLKDGDPPGVWSLSVSRSLFI